MAILDNDALVHDPDTVFTETSVAQVRFLEKRTRAAIETQKAELRARVGEQYLDLISAADCIISMSRNASQVQEKLKRMQSVCDLESIKKKATTLSSKQSIKDRQPRPIYVLAALIKSLADVPEQIWHALEHHHYLQAGRLYILAQVVHDHLLTDTESDSIDTNTVFPVIRRQWDAISSFKAQIVFKVTFHLKVTEQSNEHIIENLLTLMLLDQKTHLGSLSELFRMRTQAIKDSMNVSIKTISTETAEQHLNHHLKEIIQLIQCTFTQIHAIALGSGTSPSALEKYSTNLQTTFALPHTSSHQPAIASVFSPSTNAHLLVRYLPEEIQHYTPTLAKEDTKEDTIQNIAAAWLNEINELLQQSLHEMLSPLKTQQKLVETRSKLWKLFESQETSWRKICTELIGHSYSLWDTVFCGAFHTHAERLIESGLQQLAEQPTCILSPLLSLPSTATLKQEFELTSDLWPTSYGRTMSSDALLSLASLTDIDAFKTTLTKLTRGKTTWIEQGYNAFETALDQMCRDKEAHNVFANQEAFGAKKSTQLLHSYFQTQVVKYVSCYIDGLRDLLSTVEKWKDAKLAWDTALTIGRLARTLSQHTKSLAVAMKTSSSFTLRSNIEKDPRYSTLQQSFMTLFEEAHMPWINSVVRKFKELVETTLHHMLQDPKCASVLLWEDTAEEGPLPSQANHTIVVALFGVCEEMQRVQITLLDKKVLQRLVGQLLSVLQEALDKSLNLHETVTEKCALQLMFDMQFVAIVLREGSGSRLNLDAIKKLIDPINWATFAPHFDVRVERFYQRHSLFLYGLTSANGGPLDRNDKTSKTVHQQDQPNVLPVVTNTTRFTLLPIGHHTHASRAW
ncbi:hypothetical protein BDF14DRAFT_1826275 [Spinellus fusiger]|nr:hypothetical protein BDF14DRAFT_1826275 [Spinellus fusiger]